MIFGRNPVNEAFRANRPINKIILQEGLSKLEDIARQARQRRIPIQQVNKGTLDKLIDGNHQGVVAMVAAKEYVDIDDILKAAEDKGEDPFIILLDEIEDPHNLGAIIRTVDAVGAHGVVIPKRRAVGVTSTVVKAAAGAVEYVPVSRVTNMAQTIEYLKERGCWIAGADIDASENIWSANLGGPIAVVVGSEGRGIGRLVKEKCDFLVKLPMKGNINSLNASVATAVLCYEIVRQRSQE